MSKHLVIVLNIMLYMLSLFSSCSSKQSDSSWANTEYDSGYNEEADTEMLEEDNCVKISYTEMYGNTITIPVKINGLTLDMIFDTGASSTCISLVEAQYLIDNGKLSKSDIIDSQDFQTADGSISVGLRVILRKVEIGNEIELSDIEAIVVQNQQAPLLLGQSVMKHFREISVDRENRVIKFYK